MNMLTKVCGMTDWENIRAVEALGADLIGFIFYRKSPRCCKTVPGYLPSRAGRVGVFVDESDDEIFMKINEYGLSHIQFHGSESPSKCLKFRNMGIKVIKAFPISSAEDLVSTAEYSQACDYFLFDAASPSKGGSGKSFDWHILEHYLGSTPFFLSGGIGPDSLSALRSFSHPALAGYDLNSRFEMRPGIKDTAKIKDFLKDLSCNEQN